MANTTNFGWETPDDTDLVKDGAAAMRTLGNAIDTSFVDLKGGTTNQVLAKNSNTDLDFKWVTDATGIQATIFDAKGDLIAASAADTAARLASSGVNGDVLTVDTSTSTGLKWAAPASGGLVRITGTTFTSAASVSLPNNTFTSTYKDYLIVFNADTNSSTGTYRLRMRASGADDTTSNYFGGFWRIPYTGAAAMTYQTTAADTIQIMDSSPGVCFIMVVSNPQTTVRTAISFDSVNPNAVERQAGVITHLSGTQFDALSIYMTTGNITGRYDVYGYAN